MTLSKQIQQDEKKNEHTKNVSEQVTKTIINILKDIKMLIQKKGARYLTESCTKELQKLNIHAL